MKKKQILIALLTISLLSVSGLVLSASAEGNDTDTETATALSSTYTYTVNRILDGTVLSFGAALLETNDFNVAYAEMQKQAAISPNVVVLSSNSRSPMKIVAADRARVQSYPYRKGSVGSSTAAANTLNIYSNKALTTNTTYIAPHYQMAYYGTSTVSSTNTNLVLDIEINGARGYIDLMKADIIPLVVFEKNMTISLGGDNGDYYNPAEKVETFKVTADTYVVSYNSTHKVNELSLKINRTYPTLSASTTTYAIAPSWLPTGTYYSSNGINFYTDIDMKKPVNSGASFYAYYQWLPVRTMSNVTADNLYSYITGLGYSGSTSSSKYSVIVGNEQVFIENGNLYGMNALLIFAQAALESAYGSSSIAKSKYNLFGWNAVDSNTDLATSYDGVEISVQQFMSDHFQGYFLYNNWRNFGMSYGNKGTGVTVKYASDPYYGNKVAGIAYLMDRANGYQDYDAYTLTLLKDKTAIPVYKSASTSNGSWYSINASLVNQIITNLGESNGFIKTNLSQPIKNNAVTSDEIPVNLLTEFGYVQKSLTSSNLAKIRTTATIPTSRIILNAGAATYVTTDNLNLRSSWSTSSRVMTTIPKGTTVLSAGKSSNGWVRVNYNGMIGYVSADYLSTDGNGGNTTVAKGDINGDGKINVTDMMVIRLHILGNRTMTQTEQSRADLNGDGIYNVTDMMVIRLHILGIRPIE